MKIFGLFLIITFGFVFQGFSQGGKKPNLKSNESIVHPDIMHNLFENSRFSISDSLKLEPGIIHPNQPEFFSKGLSDFATPSPYRMPIFELPDPHSRMPIKVFDDSVNYTILRKEYR